MATDISEKGLETIITSYLCDTHGYELGVSDDYIKEFGMGYRASKAVYPLYPKGEGGKHRLLCECVIGAQLLYASE